MTTFHESIRSVLTEVEKFLVETLKKVTLPKSAKEQKQIILEKVIKLREDYPTLLPENQQDLSKSVLEAGRDESAGTSGSSNADDVEEGYSENIDVRSAAELKNPEYCGFLEKKQKKTKSKLAALGKTYQKRWCVIKDKIMYYYENKKDKKQNGAFSLEGYEFNPAPDMVKEPSKKPLSFELVCPDRTSFQFIAGSKDDYIGWQAAVETVQGLIEEDIYDVVGEKEDTIDDSYEITDDPEESAQPASKKPKAIPKKLSKPLPQTPPDISRDVSSGSLSDKPVEDETYEVPEETSPLPGRQIMAASGNEKVVVDNNQEIYDDAITDEQQDLYDDAITGGTTEPDETEDIYEELDEYSTNKTSSDLDNSSMPPSTENKALRAVPLPPISSPPSIKKHTNISSRRPPPNIPLPSTPPRTLPKEMPSKAQEVVPKMHKADEDFENMFYGKWNCISDGNNELSFKQGDIIHIINRDFDTKSWWVGELNGNFGLVPKNYLTPAYEQVAA